MNRITIALIGVALEGLITVLGILTTDKLLALRAEEQSGKGFNVLNPHDMRLITDSNQ